MPEDELSVGEDLTKGRLALCSGGFVELGVRIERILFNPVGLALYREFQPRPIHTSVWFVTRLRRKGCPVHAAVYSLLCGIRAIGLVGSGNEGVTGTET